MFFILIGTGCSMYLTGKLQETIKYHYLIFFGNFICAVAMFCTGFATSMTGAYVWAVVMTSIAASAPLVSNCFGLVNFGRIFGLVFTAYGFVAGFLGPWLSGFILDLNSGNFPVVFIYLALFYFIASVFIIKIKPVDFS